MFLVIPACFFFYMSELETESFWPTTPMKTGGRWVQNQRDKNAPWHAPLK